MRSGIEAKKYLSILSGVTSGQEKNSDLDESFSWSIELQEKQKKAGDSSLTQEVIQC